MSESKWTSEQQKRFRQDWDANVAIREIARRLGVSLGMVNRRARKLGLVRPAIPGGRPRKLSANEHTRRLSRGYTDGQAPDPMPVVKSPPMPSHLTPPTIWKRLLDLGPAECKWPLGERRAEDFVFCALPAHGALPYCVCHARIAYPNRERAPPCP